jgi:hypothetical protein
MKRNIFDLQPSECTRSKKVKLIEPLPTVPRHHSFISATEVRNYIMKDTLVDWLKLYGKNRSPAGFSFLKETGIQFEKDIISKIDCVTVSDKITDESCIRTVQLMNEGVPYIHSAPFRNYKNSTHGIIDLLVRCDYLKKLVKFVPDIVQMKAPNLSCSYHYVVVDIKFSTLPLRSDGEHLLNSGSYPSHKSQVWIYTDAIGEIQGYLPRYGYILGRRWGYTKQGIKMSGTDPFDRLGVIDYHDIDKDTISRTGEALNWIIDLKKNGSGWTLYPPSRTELYPNMCIDSKEWNGEKEKVAEELGDITQIWHCGIKNREKALKEGVTSWRNPKCTAKLLGIGGTVGYVVDKILEVNRGSALMLPQEIKTDLYNWKERENEVFVDFETFCDVFSQGKSDQIFLIGIFYRNSYKSFIAKEATLEEEYRIMNEFVEYLKSLDNPKLWHWSADQMIWNRAESRQASLADPVKSQHITENWALKDWCDACRLFLAEPIVVKGCYSFGLKDIAEAMYKHGMIKSEIISNCRSGFDAGILARQAYDSKEKMEAVLGDIEKYNEFDVKVLSEILEYLRAK